MKLRTDATTTKTGKPIQVKLLAEQCEAVMPLAKRDQFYGPAHDMALGAGIIVRSAAIPIFLPDREAYGTGRGAALILTHECDIEPENIRPFNDKALIAPITSLDRFVDEFAKVHSTQEVMAFATNVARGNVPRICFLPRFGNEQSPLQFGGLIDLNFVTSCAVQSLLKSSILCSLSGYAIGVIDRALQNHLLRPKTDRVPLPH